MSETKSNKSKAPAAPAGPHGGRWEEMYLRLVDYKKVHGNCLVPNRYEADPQLGSWVSTQRRHYKLVEAGEPSPMTEHRIAELEKIGFKWSAKSPRHVQWDQRFQALVRFKESYGHTQVPINWEKDVQLANWISTQRQEYQNLLKGKTSRLDEARIRLLNGIGFSWQLQRGGRKRHLQEIKQSSETSAAAKPASVGGKVSPSWAAREKTSGEDELNELLLSAAPASAYRAKSPQEVATQHLLSQKRPAKKKAKAATASRETPSEIKISAVQQFLPPESSTMVRESAAIGSDAGSSFPPAANGMGSCTPASNLLRSAATPVAMGWRPTTNENRFLEGVLANQTSLPRGYVSAASCDLALALRASAPGAPGSAVQDGTSLLLERLAQNPNLSSFLAGQDSLSRLSSGSSLYSSLHSVNRPATNLNTALSPSLLQLPSSSVARADAGASSSLFDLARMGSIPTQFAGYDSSILSGTHAISAAEERFKRARTAVGGNSAALENLDRATQQSHAAQLQALLELSRLSSQENGRL